MFFHYLILLTLAVVNVASSNTTSFSRNIARSVDEIMFVKNRKSVSTTDNYHHSTPKDNQEKQWEGNFQMNWTKEDITNLLEQHGYQVKKSVDGWPLGMIGDIAYYPEDLLPEMGMLHNRRNLLNTEKLWLDDKGNAAVSYYYDTGSQADAKVFEEAVKTWSDCTCIKFTKLGKNTCDVNLGHAAVCVGNFGGCFSLLGRSYGPRRQKSQQMSVQPDGCEMVAAAHEFGHALGLCHEMARADRDKYIHVLYRNINLDLNKLTDRDIKGGWFQGGKCSAEQMFDAPKPYDPMSLMQYGTSDFAMEDQRPVYLHKNAHYQYMFDYHRGVGFAQSHYDKLVMNLGYQCIPKWKKSCEDSGKGVPKCQNYGYVTKDCKCACPVGFSGSTCSTTDGPMFPVQDRAKAMLDVTEPGLIDLKGKGMHDENHNYPRADFVQRQYIAVIIRSGDETRISVEVTQKFENIKQAYSMKQNTFIDKGHIDCQYGIHVYVGHAEPGHMRVECISSLINNELPEYRTVFRSKNNSLDIVGMGNWGASPTNDVRITRLAMEFQFTVSFLDKPEDNLSVEDKNPGKVGAAVNKAIKDVKKALRKNLAPVIIGTVVSGLLVVAICGFVIWRKMKSGDGESSHRKSLFASNSPSDSDSSGDSSD